jgi:hypothetical protein
VREEQRRRSEPIPDSKLIDSEETATPTQE